MLGVDQGLAWTLDAGGMTIAPPAQKPCGRAYVINFERGQPFI
jgi:hypothetical protein